MILSKLKKYKNNLHKLIFFNKKVENIIIIIFYKYILNILDNGTNCHRNK